MTVALVVLNWNGKELLKRFLPEMLRYSKEATIYVIDNDSTDDSIDFLSTEFPEVNPIINTENLGYAGGYNAGLKGIKEELICLINNDIRVTKNWLPPIINFFKNNSNTGIVQPHILDEKDPSYLNMQGQLVDILTVLGTHFVGVEFLIKLNKTKDSMMEIKIYFGPQVLVFLFEMHFFKNLTVLMKIFLCTKKKSISVGEQIMQEVRCIVLEIRKCIIWVEQAFQIRL